MGNKPTSGVSSSRRRHHSASASTDGGNVGGFDSSSPQENSSNMSSNAREINCANRFASQSNEIPTGGRRIRAEGGDSRPTSVISLTPSSLPNANSTAQWDNQNNTSSQPISPGLLASLFGRSNSGSNIQQTSSNGASSPTSEISQFFNTLLARSPDSNHSNPRSVSTGSHRTRIFERNGILYAYVGGRLMQLPGPKKCKFCDKLINPLREDYEIHVVKCMTKPRVTHDTFEVTEDGNQAIIGEECPICLDEYEVGQMCARLECLCIFHKSCLDNWLSRKQCCPLHVHMGDDDKED